MLYRLALHAQSLFTAAACLGRRDELVFPGGDSAADLASATLLKLLDPLNTSVTWSSTKGPPQPRGFWRICARYSNVTLVRFTHFVPQFLWGNKWVAPFYTPSFYAECW